MDLMMKALAEIVGTFTIIFVGAGSILVSERYPDLMPVSGIPIAWGLTIAIMILMLGPISGAHFNPAVTLVFAIAKRLPHAHIGIYWISQIVGGLSAMTLLEVIKRS